MGKAYRKRRFNSKELAPRITSLWERGPILLAIPLFLILCFTTLSTGKTTGMALMVCLALAAVLQRKRLLARFTLPLLALTAFVIMCGVSTLYALSGKFALQEFLKVLSAFCVCLLLLALAPGKEKEPGLWIATVLEGGAALLSLVSIDMLSTHWISGPVLSFLGLFTTDFTGISEVESGVRMISLLNSPNTFAGCAGLGVLLALGLAVSERRKGRRRCHLACLYINALAFVLAFSMGATGTIVIAFLAYLLLERKERRSSLLVLMVETLILTVLSVALVSMTSLDTWDGFQPIPLLCAILGAAALCLSHEKLGQRLADRLRNSGRLIFGAIACIFLLIAGYALAAYNLTGGVTLNAGESLRRAAYPEPGSYTLAVQSDGPVTVTIESQNQQDTMMHTSTVLYQGDLSQAAFEVPGDSLVVYFNFRAPEGARLESVAFTGANDEGTVPLGYRLLPGFIANRLQGLWANQNAIQRTVFFSDGLKLFRRSPIVGLGMGAFENAVRSVQTFFYETKYAHNHYVQVLAELGVVGLLLFVGVLALSAAAVWLHLRRKEGVHPLAPALGAALVFMAGHGAVELVFSDHAYLVLAFGVFGLTALCCGDAIPTPWLNRKARGGVLLGTGALMTAFAVLLANNMRAASLIDRNNEKGTLSLGHLVQAAELDPYEWADYMLSYVVSITGREGDEFRERADDFSARLAQLDSNTIPLYLAEYYLSTGQTAAAFEMAEKYVNYMASDAEAWQDIFDLLQAYAVDTGEYRSGLARLAELLESWNAENMGTIVLSEETMDFLLRMGV